jgi:putative glycosyltransferase (TIGR04348 family)
MLLVVTPSALDSETGNGVTARRWVSILRDLGHGVDLAQSYRGGNYDLLIALHAVKSAKAVLAFHTDHPAAPIVMALTGTDLYPGLAATGVDPGVLALASRLVVLQPRGIDQLPTSLRDRGRVIFQSAAAITPALPDPDCFEVAFLAHLRQVKDPLLLPAALWYLPAQSRIRVTHAGESQDPSLARQATAASAGSARYTWLGPLPRAGALRLLARSRLLTVTSLHEGGANVVTEALAAGVPVISSRIAGSVGLLGTDYPGYFRSGDPADLARILLACEQDSGGLYRMLRKRCAARRYLTDPRRELGAWASLLRELGLNA